MTEERLPLPGYVQRTPARPMPAATPGEGAALSEDEAVAGEVWQEADNVLLLCVVPGETWGDFRGDRFAWDAPTITRPLRRLLDKDGNLAARAGAADPQQKVTENDQEFLMRTLSKDQWKVVARCLRAEVAGAADTCHLCGHSNHGDTDCGEVTSYDHLNGDHECGCPGAADPLRQAVEAIRALRPSTAANDHSESMALRMAYRRGINDALEILHRRVLDDNAPEAG
jgi:hypothetical protein